MVSEVAGVMETMTRRPGLYNVYPRCSCFLLTYYQLTLGGLLRPDNSCWVSVWYPHYGRDVVVVSCWSSWDVLQVLLRFANGGDAVVDATVTSVPSSSSLL